ncbi:MAG: transposase, partial [Actinobacteria bacterium]|nr:transposase [Actinomycetota bacterium]
EVVRHLEITESTYHWWRNQFGGMKTDDAKRLRELERENTRLSASWPTRSWRSMRSERSAGEIGRPVEATPSRGDAPRAARDLAAAGLSHRRPAPLHPAPRPRGGRP